ncbi:lipid-A-disaccharide synthase N-terminal domain-containing protein [Flavobacterium sp. CS20]|uniref:lipid-A-disaccharide synthase N-terminal domain-containing protein n=1 Tax=Flavobacterium sp. CS20 TaxID=2775246 RepID=UPI001B3A683C|nr:lipid-A-disaccharide synthase N-terminal domain-containing protein [Flavobacterium sp. CS20]QTY28235.1 lipid-A-disaccharide synthase N-terminal domain-containing protein [Flavobacterium sp. CS20]
MQDWVIYSVGFLAQLLFSSRTFYQWIASERQKQVVAPRFFWQMSLLASILLFVYGYLRHDFAIMLGQSLTYFIYIRNIQLEGQWHKFPKVSRIFLWIFPMLIIVYYYNNNTMDIQNLFDTENIPIYLLVLGIVAQLLFTFRFIYQWIYSEKQKISSLPKGFWVISLLGSILILTYGILRQDPVLVVGHSFGIVIYIRNLKLLKLENR